MKKVLYLTLLFLGNSLFADTITLEGAVQPASIVSFTKADVSGATLSSNTHTFIDADIDDIAINIGQKFNIVKNIYVKTNTNRPLLISLEALGDPNGQLVKDVFNKIRVDYKLMGNAYFPIDGTETRTLTNIALDGMGNEVGTFEMKQHNFTPGDAEAGTYSNSLRVRITAP